MDSKDIKYVGLNYEEISCDRVISDGQFGNGLQNWRFSVSPSQGNCVIPHMSYFLCEYNFGAAVGKNDNYTATRPVSQSDKIALQNNFVSTLYNACRFTVAQSEISVVNSSHAQIHTLKHRMGSNTTFLEKLGADLNGFDLDFSRRLARVSLDGVYHRDGVINCEPYGSEAAGPQNEAVVALYNRAETPLTRLDNYFTGTACYTSVAPVATIYPFMSRSNVFNITSGSGSEIKTTAADLGQAIVKSILWTLPDYSGSPGTDAQNALVIDGRLINILDDITFYWGNTNAQKLALNNTIFRVSEIRTVGSRTVLELQAYDALIANDVIAAFDASPIVNSGIIRINRVGGNPYAQADPRCGIVNQVVAYQPPLSFFDMTDPDVFFGDMEIQMTPNSNWASAAVESPGDDYYSSDIKHGLDYCFGVKSMRLYLARAQLIMTPRMNPSYTGYDYLVSNKQIGQGANIINFNIPPSTQKVICWIQDSAVGTNSKLPLTRFKVRQFTGASGLQALNRYGPWTNTYDENINQLQLNFAGVSKPVTSFVRGGSGQIGESTVNNMLQRWIMTNQNQNDRQEGETYNDWLSAGAYYCFDFSRSADNLGTYLTVNMTYAGSLPTTGNSATDTATSNINLYVCAVYQRDVALSYGQYGNVVSAQTQMR